MSSTLFLISSWTSFVASLKYRMPFPNPLANSGIFFEPKSNKIISRMTKISPPPKLKNSNNCFISLTEYRFLFPFLFFKCIKSKGAGNTY